ncbi:Helix-turn-helix domain-containing protein [Marinobacterium lutimaris]|uniref:Helix-turn-helix domain-containing protein n=2 Tax=Marinobacterium lutimaris TaxID=568106 RepID=A0A1H5XMQ1_9GAMM|nr:Helix-turn-helix domain-containing protein [Marinobacterium lutimaris]
MVLMVEALQARIGNPGRKLVLIKLADNANDKGECWPSYQHVADQCEMGRSTVKAHIKALAAAGFIKVTARNDGKSSNAYLLTIKKGDANLTGSKPDPVKDEPGQDSDTPRSDSDPLTRSDLDPRTSHSPEPVIEDDDARTHEAAGAVDSDHIPADQLPDHEQRLFDQPSEQSSVVPFRKAVDPRKFPMSWDWEPHAQFAEHCRLARLDLSKFEPEQSETILAEFRSYWIGQNLEQTQSQWEHKLRTRLQMILAKKGGKPPAGPDGTGVDFDDDQWIDGVDEVL